MKVLVVGSGGREHALVWKVSKNLLVEKIYCAPGNGGIGELAECINIKSTDIELLVDFAKSNKINLTIVGPEDSLSNGIVNAFEKEGLSVFGPTKEAAIIESSKAFSKELMKKYNIPTADYETFEDPLEAIKYLNTVNYPIVIKTDGLAAGKGVIIAQNYNEAVNAVKEIMENKVFGTSGEKIVIEEFLVGQEVSILAFTDGKTLVPMVSVQDHKKVFDNDKGPNTGGMGTFSPSRIYSKEIEDYCMKNIFIPTMEAMKKEDRTFKGILYFGLILTSNGIKVLEYNARFGDPETQVIMPRLKTDIIEIIEAVINEKLSDLKIKWEDNVAVCVVLTSGGYPQEYEKGFPIQGLNPKESDVLIFHAGTKRNGKEIITAGGRVLGVTATGEDMDEARNKAYSAVKKISFHNMHYRGDIGIKRDI